MPSQSAAQAVAVSLATVIGGLLEDHANDALMASVSDLERLAWRLERLGGDVTVLAEAMLVLIRDDHP